jgi:hypothetical protein
VDYLNRPRDFNEILRKLSGAKENINSEWIAQCPLDSHKTPEGHVSAKDAGDKALITCHGGRHNYQDFCQAWDFDSLEYSDGISIGKDRNSGTPPSKERDLDSKTDVDTVPPSVKRSGSPAAGLTMATLAEAKHLPIAFLESLGVCESKSGGLPFVKIPYYSEDGTEQAIRFRMAMTGDSRFKWRRGDHTMPYGLNKLEIARKLGWILVVEGESDCWTAWYHNLPAIGAPGKSNWPLKWGAFLKDLDVYLWQEPDAQDFTLRVLESAQGLRYIPAPDGIKDISEAHIHGIHIPEWLEGLKRTAEPGQELKTRITSTRLAESYEAAKSVIQAIDPLERVKDALRRIGYGGDLKPALITYLAATSRLLGMRDGAMPVHLLLIGPPSAGKSYTVNQILKLLPEEAYHIIDAGSPRTLIYDNSDLRHKVVIFSEADSIPTDEDNPAASAIRNLLQDHQLHYVVTVRDADTGDFTVREINKPGPTVLITTSTKPLGAQLMTRLFTLEISDSDAQIRAALT